MTISNKRLFILVSALTLILVMAACDKNSTPINESDAPRDAARRHIASAIEQETAHLHTGASAAAEDGATSAMAISGVAPMADDAIGDDGGAAVRVIEGVALAVPASWRETPQGQLSAMRAAEFQIPPGGDSGADVRDVEDFDEFMRITQAKQADTFQRLDFPSDGDTRFAPCAPDSVNLHGNNSDIVATPALIRHPDTGGHQVLYRQVRAHLRQFLLAPEIVMETIRAEQETIMGHTFHK